jgi:hypothetical protein
MLKYFFKCKCFFIFNGNIFVHEILTTNQFELSSSKIHFFLLKSCDAILNFKFNLLNKLNNISFYVYYWQQRNILLCFLRSSINNEIFFIFQKQKTKTSVGWFDTSYLKKYSSLKEEKTFVRCFNILEYFSAVRVDYCFWQERLHIQLWRRI